MPAWLVASIAWSAAVGVLGVTIKYSLRFTEWPLIVVVAAGMYVVLGIAFVARGSVRIHEPGWWLLAVAASGVLAAGSFPLLNFALKHGNASQVVPITATYPIITAVLAALFLQEALTATRVAGIALVAIGAALVAR
jgi:uncharacterized membrane protein